jgi:hypothetical protein
VNHGDKTNLYARISASAARAARLGSGTGAWSADGTLEETIELPLETRI